MKKKYYHVINHLMQDSFPIHVVAKHSKQ